jgi:CelD/BcsL family acetyltransferase involved in cellulose biosynthesis
MGCCARVPDMMSEDLAIQVEDGFEGLDALRSEWDQAVQDMKGPIYMTYDWARTWWRFYGTGRNLRLFLCRAGGRIVGIVPIYLDALGVFPMRLRIARIVGACIPPKVLDPPISEAFAGLVWSEILTRLFRKDGCDIFSLGPISEHYPAAEALRKTCRQRSEAIASCRSFARDVHTVYHLPSTYEEYFGSLDRRERKVRRKTLRDLEGSWPVRMEVVRDPASVEDEFEAFADQHTRQWQKSGKPGHFHAWPDALEYNRALVRAQGPLGRVRFARLLAGDQVVANQYAFAFGKTLFAELSSRVTGEEWERFSLGGTSQVKLIEAAIGDGFERMDSGLGHYDYKILTGGRETRADVIHVLPRRAASRVQVACCRVGSALLRILLHQLWYRRIMPRLPASFRRGQSRLLLRLDF